MYSWTKLEVVLIEWTKFSSSGSVSMSGLTWGHLLIPKFHCQLISPHRSQSLEILKNLENYCFGPCQRQMLLNFIFWFSQMISGLKALNRTILQSHCVTHDSSILKSSPNSGSTCLSVVKSAIHWVWRGRKGKTNTDTQTQTDTYRHIHRQTRRPRDSSMTKQAHKNMNTNIDVIIDVRLQKFRNTKKCKAFCVAYVQKKRNNPTFHDFDWSLPEQRFAFFQQCISFWTPTLGICQKRLPLPIEMPFSDAGQRGERKNFLLY